MSTSGRTSVSSADNSVTNIAKKDKLRSSCDNCATSKVRCTKEQPICSRCQRLGLECVYGLSQRRGKPPLSRRSRDSSANTTHTNTDAEQSLTAEEHLAVPQAMVWDDPSLDYANTTYGSSDAQGAGQSFSAYSVTLPQAQMPTSYVLPAPGLTIAAQYGVIPNPQLVGIAAAQNSTFQALPQTIHTPQALLSNAPPPQRAIDGCVKDALNTLTYLYFLDQQNDYTLTLPASLESTTHDLSQYNLGSTMQTLRTAIAALARLTVCPCIPCSQDPCMPFLLQTISTKILRTFCCIYATEFEPTKLAPTQQYSSTPNYWGFGQQGMSSGSAQTPIPTISLPQQPDAQLNPERLRMKAQALWLELRPFAASCPQLGVRLRGTHPQRGTEIQLALEGHLHEGLVSLKSALEAVIGVTPQ